MKRKFCKYREKSGALFAFILIIRYVLRDLINYLLTLIIKKIIGKESRFKNKEILFIEPFQQGFGDLIFQTPLFEALHTRGYKVNLLIKEEHYPIIENNPFIYKVFFRQSIKSLLKILFSKFETIFVLSRDTIPETLLALLKFRSQIILMDSDLNFWNQIFNENHTLAWQKILKRYFDSNLTFKEPEVYREKKESSDLKNKIGIIAGIDKKEKTFKNMANLIQELMNKEMFNIDLFGKNKDWKKIGEVSDYVNKITYKETIERMLDCNLIIGPESSLIHVSTTLKIPTLIIENEERPFDKYSVLGDKEYIYKIDENKSVREIANYSQLIISK